MIKVAVTGAAGRMGQRIVCLTTAADGLTVAAAVERPLHKAVGEDAGVVAGCGRLGVAISDSLERAMQISDVLIDFTFPEVTLENAAVCARLGKRMVIGSTGFTPEERAVLALLVRYHRRATPKMSHAPFAALPAKARKTVKYLSAILRIADGLDRSHFSHVQEVRCRASRKVLHFAVSTSARRSDVDLDLDAAKRHARYFERLFGVETAFGFLRTPADRPPAGPGSSSGARRRGKILQPNG